MTKNQNTNPASYRPLDDLKLLKQREGQTLEFINRYNVEHILRTVCAFANGEGGRILVGVDERGRPHGVPQADKLMAQLQHALFERLQPPVICTVNVVTDEDRRLLLLEVAPGADGPYTAADVIYVRAGDVTRKARSEDVVALVNRLTNIPRWEARPNISCAPEDLDQEELLRTVKQANQYRFTELPTQTGALLDSLYLIRGGALTNAAVVLFAKDASRFLPQTRARAVHYADLTREEMLDNKTFSGHTFALLAQLIGFLHTNLALTSSLGGTDELTRKDQATYPLPALREGLVNALMHRDYSRIDGGISLTIYPNRLEIWNSGALPEGVTLTSLREGGISHPRNPDLAQVLLLRGLAERLGIGGRRILEACRALGMPDPEWEERAGGVQLTLRLPKSAVSIGATATTVAGLVPRALTFLATLKPGESFTSSIYQERAASQVSERQGRADLAQMLKARMIERRGSGQSTYYVRTERLIS